jgi:beta-phosphoglucomutase-like phosphatase (HAD superfamily)
MSFRGAIFDVDGVLVDSPHEQAWREGLQEFMENERGDVRDQTSYAPRNSRPRSIRR